MIVADVRKLGDKEIYDRLNEFYFELFKVVFYKYKKNDFSRKKNIIKKDISLLLTVINERKR